MPTLTVDLPETAYRNALGVAPPERSRLIADLFSGTTQGDAAPALPGGENVALPTDAERVRAAYTDAPGDADAAREEESLRRSRRRLLRRSLRQEEY